MRFYVFLCTLLPFITLAKNIELTYEPAIVEIVGALDLQAFPGPPNYESIKSGDTIERHFYLKLEKAVDVIPQGNHPTVINPEKERDVRIMQLAINGEDDALWSRFRKIGEGGRVKITGTLFHQFTGHHHSRILLNVKTMEPLGKSP